MAKTKADPDADGDAGFHAKQMASHEALASKHRALADHHRRLHDQRIRATEEDNTPKGRLLAAARQISPASPMGGY